MKKLLCLIVVSFFLLTGCGTVAEDADELEKDFENEEVVEEKVGDDKLNENNVRELFEPTLKAVFLGMGSNFYDVEKDENGNGILYDDGYLITTETTYEKILEEYRRYSLYGVFAHEWEFTEDGENLFVDNLWEYASHVGVCDLNSIELYQIYDDKYYVCVDVYTSDGKDLTYNGTTEYTVVFGDGLLRIIDVYHYVFTKNTLPDESEREYLYADANFVNRS